MKSKRITIKQIAQALNVSISTVSKALNDSYEISEETKKRIQEYANAHNYKPNTLALSLQNKSTKTIGILIPSILNYFFARTLSGMEKVAAEKGYNLITCITNESFKKEVDTVEMLSNGAIDGLIACLSEETLKTNNVEHFNNLLKEETPVVLYDRVHKDIHCDKIVTDNIKTAYKATRYLMKSDCKNIAFVSTIDGLNVGKFRAQGYLKALTKYGVTPNNDIIIRLENVDKLKEKLSEMLDRHTVDGIFTIDEISGAVATQVVHAKGLKIPNDISIIGFTNGVLAKHCIPPLTTVNQFGVKMGESAAKRLIDKIENKVDFHDFKTEIIRTELIERESTKNLFIKF